VATVANPAAGLWTVPIPASGVVEESEAKPFPLSTADASAPQFGGGSLVYLSSLGAGDGVWLFDHEVSTEIWKGSDGAVLTSPAPSRDGRKIAMVIRREGKLRLHVLTADGGEVQTLAETIDVRGGASWSPDGGLIAYVGANVSAYAPLLAIRADGTPVELPRILMRRDGERLRFTPDGHALIYMQGAMRTQDFWLLELKTLKTRQLTRLSRRETMRTFDVTPDGKRIVFDRLRDNSDIVLIDLPKSTTR